MKKLSAMVKESASIDEMEDYFLNINDILGSPRKSVVNSGDFIIYEFSWKAGVSIGDYNNINDLENIFKCIDSIKEVKVSQERLVDYDIDFKLSDNFNVRVISNNKSDTGYKFIIRENGREIILSYVTILRYFKNIDCRVLNIEYIDNELEQTSSVRIVTNSSSEQAKEFCSMFNLEYAIGVEEDLYYKGIYSSNNGGAISIYPEDEKTYIQLDRLIQ